MKAQVIFHKYKDKVMSVNVLGLKKIEYISSVDGTVGEIDSDFEENFTINGKCEIKFIGSSTVDIKASNILAVNFI